MSSDGSIGNFIVHLSTHRVTEESHKRKIQEIQNNGKLCKLTQPCIDEMIRSNPIIKNNRDQKFVGILIKDN